MWLVKLTELWQNTGFGSWGIYPRTLEGLKGILFSPLLHSGFSHLTNNSVSFLILTAALLYFYQKLGYTVFFFSWFLSGLWLWCIGRESYHIGASGIIYALAAFLFFSGVFRKNKSLAVVSLLVTFLYGSMVWGVLPIDYKMSFEGHLAGALAGFALAVYYRKQGPRNDTYRWEEEDEGPEDDDAYWKTGEEQV